MTDKKILEEVEEAMELGRRQGYQQGTFDAVDGFVDALLKYKRRNELTELVIQEIAKDIKMNL